MGTEIHPSKANERRVKVCAESHINHQRSTKNAYFLEIPIAGGRIHTTFVPRSCVMISPGFGNCPYPTVVEVQRWCVIRNKIPVAEGFTNER